MATRPETAQYIVDQLSGLGGISTRRMFGEYALYLDTKVVGFICDDQLFLKPTEAARQLLESPAMAAPYPGAKLYYVLTDELEQRDRLKHLIQATANALPLPKMKSPKPPGGSAAPTVPAKKVPAKKVHAKKISAKKVTTKTVASKKVEAKTSGLQPGAAKKTPLKSPG